MNSTTHSGSFLNNCPAFSDEFARVKEAIRVKEGLDTVHPCHALTVLFGHESTLHQADAVLTRGGPFPRQRLPNQPLGKRVHALVVLGLRRNNSMEIPITHVSNDAPL